MYIVIGLGMYFSACYFASKDSFMQYPDTAGKAMKQIGILLFGVSGLILIGQGLVK